MNRYSINNKYLVPYGQVYNVLTLGLLYWIIGGLGKTKTLYFADLKDAFFVVTLSVNAKNNIY